MDVHYLEGDAVERHPVDDLPDLLTRDGMVWVDVPTCDAQATAVLSDVFGFHPMAVRASVERTRVPKVHAYADHVFVVLHGPEQGEAGHMHYIELDLFIGPNYLVTVHGPVNPAVDPAVPTRETRAVRERLESGRLRPDAPWELSYAIVSTLVRNMEALIERLTRETWRLEQAVTAGHSDDSEEFLEELFQTRHGLLTVRTMAMLGGVIQGRIGSAARFIPDEGLPYVDDLIEQFDRVRRIADGQKEYVEGVIEYYRTRTETKMMIAAERLAVIAVVTLPITALASIYGMNLIVNARTDVVQLIVVLLLMSGMSAMLLRWAKRQGWW